MNLGTRQTIHFIDHMPSRGRISSVVLTHAVSLIAHQKIWIEVLDGGIGNKEK
jgi:hypothetical protein